MRNVKCPALARRAAQNDDAYLTAKGYNELRLY